MSFFTISANKAKYQNVIFMSDGQSGDNIVSAASVFHNAGIHVTPVAMGRGADKATLRKMTGSAGLKNKFFEYTSAAAMESGAQAMFKALCD